MRSRRAQGLTLVELLVALGVLLVLMYGYLKISEFYYRGVLRSAGTRLLSHLNDARKLAVTNPSHKATLVFRPTSGPYRSYYVFSEKDEPKEFLLPPGIRLINTNGFIRNHTLVIDAAGDWLDDEGKPRTTPDPGLLTLISDATERIFVIRVGLKTGTLDGD